VDTYPTTIFDILKKYRFSVGVLVLVAIGSNVLNLFFPRLITEAIDTYIAGTFDWIYITKMFVGLSLLIFLLTFIQGVLQAYVSEKSAKDIRKNLIKKISEQSYMYTQEKTAGYLLTNLTSDVDAIKSFLGTAVPAIISAFFALIGASILILITDWKLGLGVLTIIPVIAIVFGYTFSKMGKLFSKVQYTIDKLNTVINSTIIGASLVRVLHSKRTEMQKFEEVSLEAKDNGMKILFLFSSLIPIVMLAANLASLIILYLGGIFVVRETMTLGQFAAFNSYITILIFPIFIIGFTSSSIGQAMASMARIKEVLLASSEASKDNLVDVDIDGDIAVQNLSLTLQNKDILKDISFNIKKGTKVAIIGPTAAGKTQLLAVLSGLVPPTSGKVTFNGRKVSEYNPDTFYTHVALVFQDSVLFNLSLRENIAFGSGVTEESLEKAIQSAELSEFVKSLPSGLDTSVSERGLSLSGGQKQRIMLARALATNPEVLLLDDFTARVDALTEKKILENISNNYPGITLISVTQKVSTVEAYEQIIVLVEGEVINTGTHESLLKTTPEYVQIYESQKSTTNYELQS
jgi:ATP-binding cassette, subfamily B, bacterial